MTASKSRTRSRGLAVLRNLAVPALALAVAASLPITGSGSGPAATPVNAASNELFTPLTVAYGGTSHAGVAKGNFLSYNDFHGAIDPPTGSGAAVNGVPAGGIEYFATWLKRLRADAKAEGRKSITVGAGDLIGATPLVSAAFHDEPTIELMNLVGLDISSVGNHEFDEGVTELLRMDRGGCHPVDGCFTNDGFAGARFTYLAANTISKRTGLPILPPVTIRKVGGVPVGFVGMTLEGTPGIVNPAGITSVEFRDEIETANRWGALLRLLGVKAMVLLLHEGGQQSVPQGAPAPGVDDCTGFSGPVVDIVAGLRREFNLVVSGHTHRFYRCSLPNSAGSPTVVTSAGNNGQIISDIDFTLNKRTGRFAEITARNVVVENGVPDGNGGWQQNPPGTFVRNPDTIDPQAKQLADKYRTAVAPIANEVVGAISADIVRDVQPSGESPLGDVIADAQLAYTASAGADLALMNPGGIRASLTFNSSPGGEPAGQVTYGEAFTVQPFNNLVVTQNFTGAQIKGVLEQQFAGVDGQGTTTKILQVSNGLTYSYNSTLPADQRVTDLRLNGAPIDPAATYQVTTNDFLANGGDGFSRLTAGTGRVTAPGFDVDALVAHLGGPTPVAPGPANRITKLG